MNNTILTFVLSSIIVYITLLIAYSIRNKLAKPKYKGKVQTPGKFDRFLLNFLKILTVIPAMLMILGIVMKETEMAIVSSILTLIFIGAVILLKHAYATSYQENSECFILKTKNKKTKVFYKNIVDWKPSYNEILIYDHFKPEEKYIRVNIALFKPEILLRTIVEMTFGGTFGNDPEREDELVDFLIANNYGYLVKDYVSV